MKRRVALVELSALAANGTIDAIAPDAQREGAEHQSGHDRAVPRLNSVHGDRARGHACAHALAALLLEVLCVRQSSRGDERFRP